MAKRKNPDEEKSNPLVIVAILAVLGIVGYFLFMKKSSPIPAEETAAALPPPGPAPGSIAAGITSILNPLARVGATVYGVRTAAEIQRAQLKAARSYQVT